ncbi:hypothetical protein T492DRAFT_941070 [Pavlovales sp. CCMP2436]|nr:hypothetical protein T492DRAFT_941070 [Pavlovales sp. CCMP2436]
MSDARGHGQRLPPTAGSVLSNFMLVSLFFSLNHGCVTSCLALASSQLGPALGGYSAGVLYLCYTLTALLFAPGIVTRLGAKGSLNWGLVLYCAYVGSYALAVIVPALRWPAVIVGAALGGLAAGWLWTAQGGYFAAAAELYAHVLQIEPESPSGDETQTDGERFHDGGRPQPKLLQAVDLMRKEPKVLLLAPINTSFGFMASLMNFYVNGVLVKQTLGAPSIGLLTSVISGVATVVSLPLSWLAARAGKSVVILLGGPPPPSPRALVILSIFGYLAAALRHRRERSPNARAALEEPFLSNEHGAGSGTARSDSPSYATASESMERKD